MFIRTMLNRRQIVQIILIEKVIYFVIRVKAIMYVILFLQKLFIITTIKVNLGKIFCIFLNNKHIKISLSMEFSYL